MAAPLGMSSEPLSRVEEASLVVEETRDRDAPPPPAPGTGEAGGFFSLSTTPKGLFTLSVCVFNVSQPVVGSINLSCTFCNVRPKSRCFVRHTTHNMKAASLSDEF